MYLYIKWQTPQNGEHMQIHPFDQNEISLNLKHNSKLPVKTVTCIYLGPFTIIVLPPNRWR